MITEPEKYFQYTIPKLHTLWNGEIRNFSHQAIAGFQYFISAYRDKKLVVLITEATKNKLKTYFDSMAKQKSNIPLMELSHTGRWYANGFISAYNFCEQYEKEHPAAKVDFLHYADILEQTNEARLPSNDRISRNYIVNIGRIEGVRFYLKEQELSNNSESVVSFSQPQVEKTTGEDQMYNSTGLTLRQNLNPATFNQRIIQTIDKIIEQHRGKKSERTIAGYCIIAILTLRLVKKETSKDILTAAFWNDYFPKVDWDNFSGSIRRVLRAYDKKNSDIVLNADEKWGAKKEQILQNVLTLLKKAVSNI